ncbi:MAG: TonB-dependent receptor plug domain-containing protein, partial [Gammaproteobacteria bacterium]|nr:TonB-dependent receptor plug domain-containing protein [Gammaproteobacteria bacterium]
MIHASQSNKRKERAPSLRRTKLNAAILSVLAATTTASATAELEEVVVTATKRESSLLDIPVTVQAIGEQNIQDLNIKNFDDYVRYLPNVAMGGRGPGQSEVYIRGMSIDAVNVMLAGAQGSTPNVAVYLDEQPITSPGRNLDIYTTDIQRIEVLPGPQGTLFGASSQAGTLRIITKKPKINEFEAGFKGSTASTYKGEMSSTSEGYLNLPLVDDKLAVRAVFYNANEGGYIDNVYGSFTPDPNINPTLPANEPAVATYESATNVDLVEADFNDTSYKGYRVGAKYLINDEWSLLVQHMQQTLMTDGVFDYDPNLGDLKVQRYFADTSEDSFNQTTWTLEGRLGALEALYTGAFLDREIEQSIDYTGYNNVGGFIAYYTCTYDAIRECLDPTKGFLGQQDITRSTHEFRIATPADGSLRLVAGVF